MNALSYGSFFFLELVPLGLLGPIYIGRGIWICYDLEVKIKELS